MLSCQMFAGDAQRCGESSHAQKVQEGQHHRGHLQGDQGLHDRLCQGRQPVAETLHLYLNPTQTLRPHLHRHLSRLIIFVLYDEAYHGRI